MGDLEDVPLTAVDDSAAPSDADVDALAGIPEVKTTAAVSLRKDADATAGVLAIVPEGMVLQVESQATNGFYNVSWNGVSGYVSASYLAPEGNMSALDEGEEDAAVDVDGDPSPANAIARAKLAMGFSYYWGGGAWTKAGVTASTKGSCTGSCPNCTHRGSYGADCSGLVAKAWQYGAKNLSTNSHPYGTIHFVRDVAGKWKTITRASMKPGDALVYNKNGSGHIVIYEKGDAWGAPTVMECRSCGYGCVRNARSFGSQYHAIRRTGF
ncbi:MAG: SH3 domain-containing protein [Labilithrix sp.]|nr:SH3 domain-containing protein [Labilithrix sp.]MCW5815978.1 SH3 domain-containing protein [Labilithrix sp.]